MNDFDFVLDEEQGKLSVPYFEDATAKFAPYYTVSDQGATISIAKTNIADELEKLGGEYLGGKELQ